MLTLIRRYILFSLFVIFFLFPPFSSMLQALELVQNTYTISTANGNTQGFFITRQGHFLTGYDIIKGLYGGKVGLFNGYSEDLIKVKTSLLEGFAILRLEREFDGNVLELGDSDLVDIGDSLYMLSGSSKVEYAKVLSKPNHFNEYNFPCFVTSFSSKKEALGKAVFSSIDDKVVGIFIFYKGNYLVVPINRIKPYIKDYLKKKEVAVGITKDKQSVFNAKAIRQFGGELDYNFGFISDMGFGKDGNIYFLDYDYKSVGSIDLARLLNKDRQQKTLPKNLALVTDNRKDKAAKEATRGVSTKEEAQDEAQNEVKEDNTPPSITKDVKRLKLNMPISLAMTDSGLIFVLDNKDKKLVVLNKHLGTINKLSYKKIAPLFNPIMIKAIGNTVYVVTDVNRYYYLSFDAKTGKTKAILINNKLNTQNPQGIKDIAYDSTNSYWLFSTPFRSRLYIIDKNNSIMKEIALRESIPSSVAVYKDNIYILDKEHSRVSVYNKEGVFLRYWNGAINAKAQAGGYPALIRISSFGVVSIVYHGSSYIRLFSIDAKLIKDIKSFGSFSYPVSTSLNPSSKELAVVTEDSNVYLVGQKQDQTKDKQAKPMAQKQDKDNLEEDANIATSADKPAFSTKEIVSKRLLLDNNASLSIRAASYTALGKLLLTDIKSSLLFPLTSSMDYKALKGKLNIPHGSRPIQLSVVSSEIFVLDKANHRVIILDETGILKGLLLISDDMQRPLYPQDISVSEDGNKLFVLAENKVLVYDRSSDKIKEFSIASGNDSYMGYAKGIAYSEGLIYVADTYNSRVLVYDDDANLKGHFGRMGGSLDEFVSPWDIVATKQELYVVDKGNHRVVLYSKGDSNTSMTNEDN